MKAILNSIALFTTVLTTTSLINYPASANNTDQFLKFIPEMISTILQGNNNNLTKQIPTIVTQQTQCPNISGAFQRPGDNLIIFWEQEGCNIKANAPSGGFNHFLEGKWAGQYFNYRVYRTNIRSKCETTMYGRLYAGGGSNITTLIYGTDARCDLPANFKESAKWSRI
jgi:hypothetical protein